LDFRNSLKVTCVSTGLFLASSTFLILLLTYL